MKGICEKHGEFEQVSFSFAGKELLSSCPKCLEEVENRENKELEAERIKTFQKYNIEKEFLSATFENYKAKTDRQKKALEACKKMAETKSGKLVLLGANGIGKTHLGVSIVKVLSGAIYSMYEIATRIKTSYTVQAKETELAIVSELASLPMLVIDELGRTKGSEAETNWLSYIIDKRHVRGLPFILLSNNHLQRDCKTNGCSKCLERFLDNDVLSRLTDNGEIIIMDGEDYRRTGSRK